MLQLYAKDLSNSTFFDLLIAGLLILHRPHCMFFRCYVIQYVIHQINSS